MSLKANRPPLAIWGLPSGQEQPRRKRWIVSESDIPICNTNMKTAYSQDSQLSKSWIPVPQKLEQACEQKITLLTIVNPMEKALSGYLCMISLKKSCVGWKLAGWTWWYVSCLCWSRKLQPYLSWRQQMEMVMTQMMRQEMKNSDGWKGYQLPLSSREMGSVFTRDWPENEYRNGNPAALSLSECASGINQLTDLFSEA